MNEIYYFFVHMHKFDTNIAKITHQIGAPHPHMHRQNTSK
ncbi:hypothetical protein APS_0655 [Acetobacter pasteurianus subsp. pasteurianus LMG 1262 = NBRC 106471]|nr:hypothetical protein APS_0655 [Acetobacter pasteurianus subsp. pasteurianus LMG 1262 = NBRC 106471]